MRKLTAITVAIRFAMGVPALFRRWRARPGEPREARREQARIRPLRARARNPGQRCAAPLSAPSRRGATRSPGPRFGSGACSHSPGLTRGPTDNVVVGECVFVIAGNLVNEIGARRTGPPHCPRPSHQRGTACRAPGPHPRGHPEPRGARSSGVVASECDPDARSCRRPTRCTPPPRLRVSARAATPCATRAASRCDARGQLRGTLLVAAVSNTTLACRRAG